MIRKMGSFRSYVGLEEYEMKVPKGGTENLQPDLLEGELVIAEALNVVKFSSWSKKKGVPGSLFVTNARVIFVFTPSDNRKIDESVPLLSLNMLWYYEQAKGSVGPKKHRHLIKLGPSSTATPNPNLFLSGSTRVQELLIACSTFKMFRFGFKFSPLDHGLKICNAVIHHAFPVQLDRIFYFDHLTVKYENGNWRQRPLNTPTLFFDKGDWLKELNITRCSTGYRISNANEDYEICGSLPEWVVVPADMIDVKLRSLAEKLKGSRPPHWSWADSKGAGILRMSKLISENDSSAENAFFELLRKTHPSKLPPEIFDLDNELPIKELRNSLNKLFEMCLPESYKLYEEIDSRFYSMLEHTKWMHLISRTLDIVSKAAVLMTSRKALVILQEQESRDTACLCSSLIQVAVDPRFRTVAGFFSLIQKEWIAFGHRFHSVYMHASPVFLLFLDCVQQLMKQNPVDFEFNDKLLASIWECSFDTTRGTFIFDSPADRKSLDQWKDLTTWELVLSPQDETDVELSKSHSCTLPKSLINPLYKLKHLLQPPKLDLSGSSHTHSLAISSSICDLTFWGNLYHQTFNTMSSQIGIGGGRESISNPNPVNKSKVETQMLPSPATSMRSSSTSLVGHHGGHLQQYYSLGRDPRRELRLIESLLGTLSTSTRYSRHSSSASGHSKTSIKDKANVVHPANSLDSRRRRNPFSGT